MGGKGLHGPKKLWDGVELLLLLLLLLLLHKVVESEPLQPR